MITIQSSLPDVLVFEPKVFKDTRGFFLETWSANRYQEAGIIKTFVQDNISFSKRGTLRGLHYQHPHGQGKLVQAISGQVYDLALDIRSDSPTFRQWFSIVLDANKHNQVYIPPGFAHGFLVLSETALFSYKCTDYYNPEDEYGIIWHDADIAIDWPLVGEPIVSDKDKQLPTLNNIVSCK